MYPKIFAQCLLLFVLIIQAEKITFAAIADPQFKHEQDMSKYANNDSLSGRCYGLSKEKLRRCVSQINNRDNINFVITLGDVVDTVCDYTGENNIESMMDIYSSLNRPYYFVVGNHDEGTLEKKGVELLGIDEFSGSKEFGYYSFRKSGFRFLVLDTQDKWGNWEVSDDQLIWLRTQINSASHAEEPVIIFAHINIDSSETRGVALKNSEAVYSIINDYSNVIAYINGHHHVGDYWKGANGTHYITLKGMVERHPISSNTTYSVITIDTEKKTLTKEGFGWEESNVYSISTEVQSQSSLNSYIETIFY